MSKLKPLGKITNKNGIKTFFMSLTDISDLYASDKTFKELWDLYKLRTSRKYIVDRFDKLFSNKEVPSFVQKNKHITVRIAVSFNAEGNITRYPHRDFRLDLLTAYKLSVLQNLDIKECLEYDLDYTIRGNQYIRLNLPYGKFPNE